MRTAALTHRYIVYLLVAFGALAATDAHAEDTLGFHVASYHSRPGFCNINPGLYYRWENGIQIGGYRNSQCRPSFYGGWFVETEGRVRAGIGLGVVSGYRGRGILPVLMPSVAVSVTEHQSLRFIYFPKTHPKAAAVFHMTIEHRF